jgi:1,2-phenylacetyl-CoA epoxidase PaaB subunit
MKMKIKKYSRYKIIIQGRFTPSFIHSFHVVATSQEEAIEIAKQRRDCEGMNKIIEVVID